MRRVDEVERRSVGWGAVGGGGFVGGGGGGGGGEGWGLGGEGWGGGGRETHFPSKREREREREKYITPSHKVEVSS